MQTNTLRGKKQLLIGFTLFSMFFGAGNLIFPPYLGAQAGTRLSVSYTHLRAHETDSYLVCRLLLEKKKKANDRKAAGSSTHTQWREQESICYCA